MINSWSSGMSHEEAEEDRLSKELLGDDARCVTALVIGGGNRGQTYAGYALNFPKRMKVVGVADPRLFIRTYFKKEHGLCESDLFLDWRNAAQRDIFADVAIICTPDQMHKEPAIAFASKGYHILLEKPMAVTEKDCKEVVAATKQAGVMMCVCHVLRYSPSTIKIKELLDAGAIGDVVHIQHLEPVGFEHFAHSFVRGNWRNEKESAFSLLCKSCHDIDLINYWMDDKRCLKVSSFGSLCHFTKDDKPAGASDRCLDCMVEESCPYSAKKIYLERAQQGVTGWPLSVICPDSQVTVGAITEALRSGPYGRCVYQCDNDVVTNQVVNMEFQEGATAALTMIAFSQKVCVRKTTIYGTKGELHCEDTGPVNVYDFHTKEFRKYAAPITCCHSRYLKSHGGADLYLIHTFCRAVALQDPSLIFTGPDVSLDSHLLVFAAERARQEAKVIFL